MASGLPSPCWAKMAGNPVPPPYIFELRLDFFTNLVFVHTTCMEMAALRWVDRTRHISFEDDPFFLDRRIRNGHSRKQRFGIGVLRIFIQLFTGSELDNLAEVHHCHPVTNMFHNVQIVSNEEIRQTKFCL